MSKIHIAGLCAALMLSACKGKEPAGEESMNQSTPKPEATPSESGAGATKPEAAVQAQALAALEEKIAQFAPVTITADVSDLPESEKKALDALIEAARLLDPVFDRQAWAGNPALAEALAADQSALGKARQAYFQIMRGPWDRQDHFAAFGVDEPRPPGAGYYPDDLTEDAYRAYLDAHPDQREALTGLYTVVRREGEQLVAVPYSKAYAEWLEPAAAKLEAAAELTENESLATFLRSRAAAFRSDDYYQSDKDWMDLDSRVEITIGPYETYEDELMGAKAAFEAFVTVADPEASAALTKFKELLPAMEQHLPVPDEVKTERGAESPIRVVDLVFASGDARTSVQTIAFNLPNDERVRKEKGAKKVLLRNVIKTKFDAIMKPVGERILAEGQRGLLSAEAFFQETLFHELSHSLGPALVLNDPKQVEVKDALGASYAAIEEGKADVMGAYNILFMIEQGHFPKEFRDQLLVTYFAGLLRSVRFGVAEAHGQGAALQINRYIEEGAVVFDDAGATFKVDLDKLAASIEALVRDMCMWQHNGDKAVVDAMLAKYGKLTPPIEKALAKLGGIPVDIRPRYPLAGE
ncbi:dipeptidyl-peptidase 3 family protein [Haliangium sp.]|uniref:dipeptidyl-peptidase 3 family protein n=1 Tax=Haliangium sp. TaxID=2663208 RepID=UPI003D0A107F